MLIPETEVGLYQWMGGIMAAYLALGAFIGWCQSRMLERERRKHKHMMAHIFNGATFSISVALFVGVMEPTVLALLGSPKVFLMISALAGIGYGIRELF